MPRSEKQKLKLYYLIEIFKKKTNESNPITISEIVEILAKKGIKAERKSIYRDIDAMVSLGYDIVSVRGKRFAYYMGERDFQLAELRLLVDIVQSSRFITNKKSEMLIKKLESLTSEHDAKQLQSQVFVTNRIKTLNESIYYTVDSIHKAIQSNVKVSFNYFDWDIKKERIFRHSKKRYCISPWSLICNNENYYLIAYDSESEMIKHYRVDRMLSLEISEEKREGESEFAKVDVEHYAECYFGMYSGRIEKVTLNCSNKVTNAIIDKFGKDIEFLPGKDENYFMINVEVAVSPVFLSWVFMFGGEVEIIAPSSIVKEMKNMICKYLKYDTDNAEVR